MGVTQTLLIGDVREQLRTLPDESAHCAITSPPYWGLRSYNTAPQIWADGWVGELGAEPVPDMYVAHLVEVFNEVHRVLRNDGTLWLNIGDCYTSGNRGYRAPDKKLPNRGMAYRAPTPPGLKEKELVGVPWLVAFGLRDAGWYLRAENIWSKTNPMPESVKDRTTRSHESLFMFAKSPKYFYDRQAILEANGRNKRSVWSVQTSPFPGAHYAVFPPKVIDPCVLAGCPEGGVVLDLFAGSGTTLAVAKFRNRHSIGIDLDSRLSEWLPEREKAVSKDLGL